MATVDALGFVGNHASGKATSASHKLSEPETFRSSVSVVIEDDEDEFHDSFEDFFPESPKSRSPSPLFDSPQAPFTPPTPFECEAFFQFPKVSVGLESQATEIANPFDTPPISFFEGESIISLNDFAVLGVLGKGGQGTIYRALHKPSNTRVALKRIKKDPVSEILTPREQECLRRLVNADGILELYGSFHDQEYFYLVTPIYGGDLTALVDRCHGYYGFMPLEIIAIYTAYLIIALERMHACGVIHRDLKPDNIFIHLRNQQPVIGDFGLAVTEEQLSHIVHDFAPQEREIVGTPDYWSKEVFESRLFSRNSDVFALGATIFFMATGKEMMNGDEMETKKDAGESGWFEGFEAWTRDHEIDGRLKDFLRKLFDGVPLNDLKTSPLFVDIDWEAAELGILPVPESFLFWDLDEPLNKSRPHSVFRNVAYASGEDPLPGFTFISETLQERPSFISDGYPEDSDDSISDNGNDPDMSLISRPSVDIFAGTYGLDNTSFFDESLPSLSSLVDAFKTLPAQATLKCDSRTETLFSGAFGPVASSTCPNLPGVTDQEIILPSFSQRDAPVSAQDTLSSATMYPAPMPTEIHGSPILASAKRIHAMMPLRGGVCRFAAEIASVLEPEPEHPWVERSLSGFRVSHVTIGVGRALDRE